MFVLRYMYFTGQPKILLISLCYLSMGQLLVNRSILTLTIFTFVGFTWNKFLLQHQSSTLTNFLNSITKFTKKNKLPFPNCLWVLIGIVQFPFQIDSSQFLQNSKMWGCQEASTDTTGSGLVLVLNQRQNVNIMNFTSRPENPFQGSIKPNI